MNFRTATRNDITKIVEMIADDELGKTRENYQIPLPVEYLNAFQKINSDENQELILLISDDEGNDISISWSRIGTVGEVIFLGKSEKTDVKVEQTVAAGSGLRCPSCNFDNRPDSKFCESCGDKL